MTLKKIDSKYYINVAKIMMQQKIQNKILINDDEILPIITVETSI